MFRFKQFSVRQEVSAMKVGTDGVLLGAWATVLPEDRLALDVGTGTGVIALMLAQRMAASAGRLGVAAEGPGRGVAGILGIDIDEAAADEAAANFAASPWASRLTSRAVSLQAFVSEREQPEFDSIVSNPPFFSASLKAPDAQRRTARHNDTLPPADLIQAARRLLSPSGRLSVIYPPEEARAFVMESESAGLYLSRLTRVISVAGQPPKRHLMEFTRTPAQPLFTDLVIGSPEYRSLTGDFYL